MNSTVSSLKPETITLIEEHARRLGISVDDYLRILLPEAEDMGLKADGEDDDLEKDMELFAEGTEPSGYQGTYPREDIYFDHD